MPDVLILGDTQQSLDALALVAKERGFRVKETLVEDTVHEWLRVKEFDALIAPMTLPVNRQQELGGKLWQKNPIAPFIIYDLSSGGEERSREARLIGADVARGADAIIKVGKILATVKPRGSLRGENFKILVVEDLDSPRDIICTYLETLGFPNVVGVRSASEALSTLEANPGEYACVFTDIKMPEITGDKFIQQVRINKNLCHLPIIALTAYGTIDCLIDCLKAGASGFLAKPPKRHDLIREIGRACRISSTGASPRLADEGEAEMLRELIERQGTLA